MSLNNTNETREIILYLLIKGQNLIYLLIKGHNLISMNQGT
jgi:hypothetical protein